MRFNTNTMVVKDDQAVHMETERVSKNRKKHNYFEMIMNKYENRSRDLEEREVELRSRLDIIQSSFPMLMLWNMSQVMQGNEISRADVIAAVSNTLLKGEHQKDRGKTRERPLTEPSPGRRNSSRLKEIEEERETILQDWREAENAWRVREEQLTSKVLALEYQTKPCEEQIMEFKQKEEKYKRKIQKLENKLHGKESYPEELDVTIVFEPTSGITTYNATYQELPSPGELRGVPSLKSQDLEAMKKLQNLIQSEKSLKKKINDMERKEKTYIESFMESDQMWNGLENPNKMQINRATDPNTMVSKYEDIDPVMNNFKVLESNERKGLDQVQDLEMENNELLRETNNLRVQLQSLQSQLDQKWNEVNSAAKVNVVRQIYELPEDNTRDIRETMQQISHSRQQSNLSNGCTCYLSEMIRINKQLKEENEKLKNQLRQKDQELEQLKQYPDKEGSSKDVPKDGPITVQTSPPILPPEISKPDRCCTTCCSNCTSACTCEKESPVSPKMTSPQAPQVSNEPCSICGTCSADPCPCNEEQAESPVSPKTTSPQAPQVSNEPCSICGTCSADPCPCNEEQAVIQVSANAPVKEAEPKATSKSDKPCTVCSICEEPCICEKTGQPQSVISPNAPVKEAVPKTTSKSDKPCTVCSVCEEPCICKKEEKTGQPQSVALPEKTGTSNMPSALEKPPSGSEKPPSGSEKPPSGSEKPPSGTEKPCTDCEVCEGPCICNESQKPKDIPCTVCEVCSVTRCDCEQNKPSVQKPEERPISCTLCETCSITRCVCGKDKPTMKSEDIPCLVCEVCSMTRCDCSEKKPSDVPSPEGKRYLPTGEEQPSEPEKPQTETAVVQSYLTKSESAGNKPCKEKCWGGCRCAGLTEITKPSVPSPEDKRYLPTGEEQPSEPEKPQTETAVEQSYLTKSESAGNRPCKEKCCKCGLLKETASSPVPSPEDKRYLPTAEEQPSEPENPQTETAVEQSYLTKSESAGNRPCKEKCWSGCKCGLLKETTSSPATLEAKKSPAKMTEESSKDTGVDPVTTKTSVPQVAVSAKKSCVCCPACTGPCKCRQGETLPDMDGVPVPPKASELQAPVSADKPCSICIVCTGVCVCEEGAVPDMDGVPVPPKVSELQAPVSADKPCTFCTVCTGVCVCEEGAVPEKVTAEAPTDVQKKTSIIPADVQKKPPTAKPQEEEEDPWPRFKDAICSMELEEDLMESPMTHGYIMKSLTEEKVTAEKPTDVQKKTSIIPADVQKKPPTAKPQEVEEDPWPRFIDAICSMELEEDLMESPMTHGYVMKSLTETTLEAKKSKTSGGSKEKMSPPVGVTEDIKETTLSKHSLKPIGAPPCSFCIVCTGVCICEKKSVTSISMLRPVKAEGAAEGEPETEIATEVSEKGDAVPEVVAESAPETEVAPKVEAESEPPKEEPEPLTEEPPVTEEDKPTEEKPSDALPESEVKTLEVSAIPAAEIKSAAGPPEEPESILEAEAKTDDKSSKPCLVCKTCKDFCICGAVQPLSESVLVKSGPCGKCIICFETCICEGKVEMTTELKSQMPVASVTEIEAATTGEELLPGEATMEARRPSKESMVEKKSLKSVQQVQGEEGERPVTEPAKMEKDTEKCIPCNICSGSTCECFNQSRIPVSVLEASKDAPPEKTGPVSVLGPVEMQRTESQAETVPKRIPAATSEAPPEVIVASPEVPESSAETPAEEVPAEEVPAEEVPAEEVPAEEVPAEEIPTPIEISTEATPTTATVCSGSIICYFGCRCRPQNIELESQGIHGPPLEKEIRTDMLATEDQVETALEKEITDTQATEDQVETALEKEIRTDTQATEDQDETEILEVKAESSPAPEIPKEETVEPVKIPKTESVHEEKVDLWPRFIDAICSIELEEDLEASPMTYGCETFRSLVKDEATMRKSTPIPKDSTLPPEENIKVVEDDIIPPPTESMTIPETPSDSPPKEEIETPTKEAIEDTMPVIDLWPRFIDAICSIELEEDLEASPMTYGCKTFRSLVKDEATMQKSTPIPKDSTLPAEEDIEVQLPTADQVGTALPSTADQVDTALPLTADQVDTALPPTADQVDTALPPTADQVGTALSLTTGTETTPAQEDAWTKFISDAEGTAPVVEKDMNVCTCVTPDSPCVAAARMKTVDIEATKDTITEAQNEDKQDIIIEDAAPIEETIPVTENEVEADVTTPAVEPTVVQETDEGQVPRLEQAPPSPSIPTEICYDEIWPRFLDNSCGMELESDLEESPMTCTTCPPFFTDTPSAIDSEEPPEPEVQETKEPTTQVGPVTTDKIPCTFCTVCSEETCVCGYNKETEPDQEAAAVDEIPIDQEPVQETAPVDEIRIDQEPVQETAPIDEIPVDQEPVQETAPVDEIPVDQEPVQETAPVDQIPIDQEIAQEQGSPEDEPKDISAETPPKVEDTTISYADASPLELQSALSVMEKKCRTKDQIITALATELKLRAETDSFETILSNICTQNVPLPDSPRDFDREQLCEFLRRPDGYAARPPAPYPEPLSARTIEVSSVCPFTCPGPKMQTCTEASSPLDLHVLRAIGADCLLLGWSNPPDANFTGYEIFVNGKLKSKVRSSNRNKTLLQNLDLHHQNVITMYGLTATGRSSEPACVTYPDPCVEIGVRITTSCHC